MKTCSILLSALLLINQTQSAPSNDVIVRKVGASWMIIFPSTQGRLITSDNPAGMIKIGQTITVAYALKLIKTGRARFVGVDASRLPSADNLQIRVNVQQAPKPFGFLVKDTRQPQLDITINPSFMAKVKGNLQEAVAQQGNLNITLAAVPGGFKIVSIVLD